MIDDPKQVANLNRRFLKELRIQFVRIGGEVYAFWGLQSIAVLISH